MDKNNECFDGCSGECDYCPANKPQTDFSLEWAQKEEMDTISKIQKLESELYGKIFEEE